MWGAICRCERSPRREVSSIWAANSGPLTARFDHTWRGSTVLRASWIRTGSPVRTLELSPDSGRLYAGGEFTTISGKTRRNLAALEASTGNLDATWQRDYP